MKTLTETTLESLTKKFGYMTVSEFIEQYAEEFASKINYDLIKYCIENQDNIPDYIERCYLAQENWFFQTEDNKELVLLNLGLHEYALEYYNYVPEEEEA